MISSDEGSCLGGRHESRNHQRPDTFTYDRNAVYADEKVWILVETSPGIFQPHEVNILDVVTFNNIAPITDDGNGIDTFTQAADDALQVIEYIHDNALD